MVAPSSWDMRMMAVHSAEIVALPKANPLRVPSVLAIRPRKPEAQNAVGDSPDCERSRLALG
jgi:hypothetical protein